jgi:ribonuclease HI
LSQIYGLITPSATAHPLPQLLLEHLAPRPPTATMEPSPRTWWTDGSLDAGRTTGGSACTDGQTTLKGSLRAPDGTLSSTSAELGAILLALRNTPANQQINLISDSQAALAIVSQPLPRHIRHTLKKPDLHLRACIQALLSNRTAPFTTTWVRGHSGDAVNELADAAANDARLSSPPLLPATVVTQPTQYRYVSSSLLPIPLYGRLLVKRHSLMAHKVTFLGCSQGEAIRHLPPLNLSVTCAALKSVMPFEAAHLTNPGNSTTRAFRFKLMMGTLPTTQKATLLESRSLH